MTAAKSEHRARLKRIDDQYVELASDARQLLGIIGRAKSGDRASLRRDLVKLIVKYRLSSSDPRARVERPKRAFSSFSGFEPLNHDGPGLQAAWILLVEHKVSYPGKELPEFLEAVRCAIQSEWHRRRALEDKPWGYFIWPSTTATGGEIQVRSIPSPSKGMLDALGYHVGSTRGLPDQVRAFILDQAFASDLPLVHSLTYSEEWDQPGTPARLQKLSETLAALARNAKRKESKRLEQAIDEWEHDLSYLRSKYYAGRFLFEWPTYE